MVLQYYCDLPWLLQGYRFSRRTTGGSAGIIRLRLSMRDRDIPLWLNTRLGNLIVDKGQTIKELADNMGIDAEGLQHTVNRFNTFAKTGKDEDFHRGDAAYDRYYGDPEVKPNPCLGSISTPPFFATTIQAGDFGTQGGLAINPDAQVLSELAEPIDGLYACGNCTAAVLPTYPGPGSTLGPAMTFAYQVAKHMSNYKDC